MRKILLILLTLFTNSLIFSQIESKFDSQLLNCVVLLEKKVDSNYIPYGTGFLLYNYQKNKPNILITCEHLLHNPEISIAIPIDSNFANRLKKYDVKRVPFGDSYWTLDGNKLRYDYKLIKDSTYVCNITLDIAAIPLSISNIVTVIENGIIDTLKIINIKTIPSSSIRYKRDVNLGTSVYFLGFPFSIGTPLGFYTTSYTGKFRSNTPTPLVRFGTVAWKSNESKEFLLDAFSYGGNSGSPVFTQIDNYNINPYLIGMVIGHLKYQASDNIGLARCIWIDDIMNLILKLNNLGTKH